MKKNRCHFLEKFSWNFFLFSKAEARTEAVVCSLLYFLSSLHTLVIFILTGRKHAVLFRCIIYRCRRREWCGSSLAHLVIRGKRKVSHTPGERMEKMKKTRCITAKQHDHMSKSFQNTSSQLSPASSSLCLIYSSPVFFLQKQMKASLRNKVIIFLPKLESLYILTFHVRLCISVSFKMYCMV